MILLSMGCKCRHAVPLQLLTAALRVCMHACRGVVGALQQALASTVGSLGGQNLYRSKGPGFNVQAGHKAQLNVRGRMTVKCINCVRKPGDYTLFCLEFAFK